MDQSAEIDARAELLMNPDTGFADRFTAVMTDLLAGQHISQTEPNDPGLFRKPADNETDDENPTNEF